MTRDGTVGRSDATEPNLGTHRDIDPVRMMRTRFADPIRASSPSGLHQQAGHMTASDLCAARPKISCQAGAIHTCSNSGTWRVFMTCLPRTFWLAVALSAGGDGASKLSKSRRLSMWAARAAGQPLLFA